MRRMRRQSMRRTFIAIVVSALTAVVGVVTGVVVWTLRHMSVGSVGRDIDRYDVYYDLTRQSEAAVGELPSGS